MNCFEQIISQCWKVAVDPKNLGKQKKWYDFIPDLAESAVFPGYLQDSVGDYHGVGWYWVEFDLMEEKSDDLDYILKLGYSNYFAEYWLNGMYIGSFEGQQLCYEIDITEAVRTIGNLLTVRIINPTDEDIDGYKFNEILKGPTFQSITPGCWYNYGGIAYPVRIAAVPKLRIKRAVVRPDMHTGIVDMDVELHGNITGTELTLNIIANDGTLLHSESAVPQAYIEKLSTRISMPVLWNPDLPYLYTAQVVLSLEGRTVHSKSERFGFREFLVKDGFFFLNGKRIYLKCGLISSYYPAGHNGTRDTGMLYREFASYKTMGFNTIRFLQMAALPEVLDICDHLGLMVYEEHPASWHAIPNPRFEELFEKHLVSTVRRDINHPSIVIWGLINESHYEEERDFAQNILGRLRDEDETRLVLLGSGRWDLRMGVGSVSNPGSREWECLWGQEEPGAAKLTSFNWTENPGPWAPELGDVHIYPTIPVSDYHKQILRTHSEGSKPAFLSECGIGSMEDIFLSLRNLEKDGICPTSPDYEFFKLMSNQLERDWERYGLGDVFAFPEEMVRQSFINNLRDREFYFDCIRSNPNYCGYCITSLVDACYAGGGILDFYRNIKPGMASVIKDGWEPLRWCLFVKPTHVYSGRPFIIEGVLANEDVLKPGKYSATLSIVSDMLGCVWKKRVNFQVPEPPEGGYPPFAVPVLKEQLELTLPEGEYRISVRLDHGAQASAGRMTFHVSEPKPLDGKKIRAVGLDEKVLGLLSRYGVITDEDTDVIIIGKCDSNMFGDIFQRVQDGATAVFLDMAALADDADHLHDHKDHPLVMLPFEEKGCCTYLGNWYYHHESILKNHPYFAGLQLGMLKYDYYSMVTPQMIVRGTQNLLDIAAVAISLPESTGCLTIAGYTAGEELAAYSYGRGKIVLNTFRILETLGENPASDSILLNIIRSS